MAMMGIIGGSGFYRVPELAAATELAIATPYGQPSAPLRIGSIGQVEVAFLPRHGVGHHYSPSDLPYRANIYAMKSVGVTHLLGLSAVGSLAEEIPPQSFVVPDQIIDRTHARARSFFDAGVVAHVGVADPFCPHLRRLLLSPSGLPSAQPAGTYLCIEGPQFSTRAESRLYRSWGATVIGMTAMPEARLAREAELCYATVAMVTDYDVWHETESDVSVDVVLANLERNDEVAVGLIRRLASQPLPDRTCGCGDALRTAIMTDRARISADQRQRLGIIAARYLGAGDTPRP
jgi:5'-methylthioadenosine phosphorylase